MKKRFFPAAGRGHVSFDWLDTYHSFSFGNFYDPSLMGFGALRVVNDDTIAAGTGFGEHPHQDMEIITIPLSGALAHADNAGGQGIVRAGDVQVMSAGSHVAHSEKNASETESVSLFQIWIETALPGAQARYDQKAFVAAGRQDQLQLLVSPDSRDGSLMIHQNAFISRYDFSSDASMEYILHDSNNNLFLMVIGGEATAADTVLARRDALGIEETESISVTGKAGTGLLFIEVPR